MLYKFYTISPGKWSIFQEHRTSQLEQEQEKTSWTYSGCSLSMNQSSE